MNSKTVKAIIGAALIGFMCVSNLLAQDPPNAEVVDGNLVLDPGGPNEQIIPKPDGTVEANGDLTIGGTTISKPTATVEDDGRLNLGGGNFLEVPDGPPSDLPAIIQWFNTGGGETAVYATDPEWHWNYVFKGTKYLPDAPNYIWLREFGAAAYPVRDSGVGSPAGAWYYFFKFPEASVAGGTWVYLSINNFPNRMEAPNSVMEGWVYLAGEPYAKWYYVKEFDTGADVAARGTYLLYGSPATETYRLTYTP